MTSDNPSQATVAAGGSPRRLAGRSFLGRSLAAKIVVVALFLVVWHAAVALWLPSYLPTPLGVASAFVPTLLSEKFQFAVVESSLAIVVGLVIGATLGTVFGLLSGRMRWLRELMSPYINGLYALPLLAIVPPVTIWLGYSGDARMALIIVAAFLPCAVSTADGARHVPASLEDVVEVYRVSTYRKFIDLVLPSSLPFVVAGLHVAVGRAIIAAVSVEFIAGLDGLGTFVLLNARSFHQDVAFVGVVVLAVFGGLARLAVVSALPKIAPWQAN
ncbi:MAG TPA: ABC transporter permease subunit [Microbacteriaceae bacterium]